MGTFLIQILGTVLSIGVALFGLGMIGIHLLEVKKDAEVIGYMNQSGQIAEAIQRYARDNGLLPVAEGREPLDILLESRYMKTMPEGGESGWSLDEESYSLLTPVGGSKEHALEICVAARRKVGMPQPDKVFKCDGSDAPDGVLSVKDPCCLK